MKLEIVCSDGEKFTLSPFQIDPQFVSGLNENEHACVIDRMHILSSAEIHEDGSRVACELRIPLA